MLQSLKNFFVILRLKLLHRKLSSDGSFVGTFHITHNKPMAFQSRPFELFYHSRVFWICLQVCLLAFLGIWTIKNYIHVFHTLF